MIRGLCRAAALLASRSALLRYFLCSRHHTGITLRYLLPAAVVSAVFVTARGSVQAPATAPAIVPVRSVPMRAYAATTDEGLAVSVEWTTAWQIGTAYSDSSGDLHH